MRAACAAGEAPECARVFAPGIRRQTKSPAFLPGFASKKILSFVESYPSDFTRAASRETLREAVFL
jgi:hypothetical protein